VERAHRDGLLGAASLMVGAPAAADAVRRARRLPRLRVGLHLVLVNGSPLLPASQVSSLLGPDECLLRDLPRAGVRFFFSRRARKQLRAEIHAQFAAFAATGLALDHVNAQNHMHVHPTVLSLVLDIGRAFGMHAVRVPHEPGDAALLRPWTMVMRWRLRRAGMVTNDAVLGIRHSGAMSSSCVVQLLQHLPEGVTEMYFHPATGAWSGIDPAIAHYDFAGELASLLSQDVRAAVARCDASLTTYSDLVAARRRATPA
jgi:hopanoid biosynthesis associated protein HpnK